MVDEKLPLNMDSRLQRMVRDSTQRILQALVVDSSTALFPNTVTITIKAPSDIWTHTK